MGRESSWNRFTFSRMTLYCQNPCILLSQNGFQPHAHLELRTSPRHVFPGFLIQVFSHNVKLLFIKPFSLYLITALESPKVRNKIGNWLDWKRGFLVVGLPSEASLMTWKSSNEDTTTESVQVASGFQETCLPGSDFW